MRRVMIATFVLLATVGTASATSVLRMETSDLAARADVIVHGVVVSHAARETQDGIVTDVHVEVTRWIKGDDTGPVFDFTIYGGIIGERGSAISGAPTYEEGEEILVFLDRPNRLDCRMAIGLAQGKYSIRQENGRRVAYRNLEGLRLVDPETGDVEEAGNEQGVDFARLLATIERQLQGDQGGGE